MNVLSSFVPRRASTLAGAVLLAAALHAPAARADEAATLAELRAIVERAVEATGATGMSQLGLVMKAAQAQVAGRADGGRVAAVVKQVLSGS